MREPYQFAVLRYLHDATSGEFVNVGVVLWVPQRRRLHFAFNARYGRISSFFPGLDGAAFRAAVSRVENAFAKIAKQLADPQCDLFADDGKTFDAFLRTIVREDETALRWSPLMFGTHRDPARRTAELFEEFVTRYEKTSGRTRRDEAAILRGLEDRLAAAGLVSRLERNVTIESSHVDYTFKHAWRNGALHVLEPISFDLARAGDIRDRALLWSGRMYNLADAPQDFYLTSVIAAPEADPALRKAYDDAVATLRQAPRVREVVEESEVDHVIARIRDEAH